MTKYLFCAVLQVPLSTQHSQSVKATMSLSTPYNQMTHRNKLRSYDYYFVIKVTRITARQSPFTSKTFMIFRPKGSNT